jgi:RES domain-containing protein
VKVWRIATENKKYLATDLSGTGAALEPGRWNQSGSFVLYTADSAALAMLETVAHIDSNDVPQLKYLISIDIPDASWMLRLNANSKDLPSNWNAIPYQNSSAVFGSDWLDQKSSLVLCVPSAITPEDTVILINPLHPKANTLKAKRIRLVDYKTVFRPLTKAAHP